MTDPRIAAGLVFETRETAARIAEIGRSLGLDLIRQWDVTREVPNVEGERLLFVEDRSRSGELQAQTQSFAAAAKEALVVVIVNAPRENVEARLYEAGAFDVLDDGPDFERQLFRTLWAARRYLALSDDRIRLASDLAHRERLSALGLLAAGVGHEVNNPCAAILANAAMIRDQLESLLTHPRYQQPELLLGHAPEWLEALGDCVGASRRITSIVKTLNVFSRRAPDADPEPTHLNDEVTTVLRLVGKEVRFQADVELKLDESLPVVAAAPHAMTQVVTNLVVNALQSLESSDRKDRRLRIQTSCDDQSVMLTVTDNGPGVPSEHLGRIFDPFFTTKSGVGSGLGLAITREIVIRAGGDIFVESQPGQGARFTVVLPRTAEIGKYAVPNVFPRPASERLRVMIVDDDDLLLRSITRSLTGQFECIPVHGVSAALASLDRDDRIDAIVSDIVMPGTNGLDLYQTLLRDRPRLARRTIFFSGGVRSEALQIAIEETGRPCIGKPVDVQELIRTVRNVALP